MVYSAVDVKDMHSAVTRIQELYPSAPLLLAGFSLGAMLVTKYLADIESSQLKSSGVRQSPSFADADQNSRLALVACPRCHFGRPMHPVLQPCKHNVSSTLHHPAV